MLTTLAQWATDIFLPLGGWGLFIVAFAESSFFPVPPDVLLIPLVLASPGLAVWFAALTTFASVLGALFGYLIGRRAGRKVLLRLASEATINRVEQLFARWGGWAVGVAAFTPIPYKVFTIAGGLFRVRMSPFLIASVVGRGARFFLLALLLEFYGQSILSFLTRYFGQLTFGLMALVALGYWLFLVLRKRHRRAASPVPSLAPTRPRRNDLVERWVTVFWQRRYRAWAEYTVYFTAGWVLVFLFAVAFAKVVQEVFFEGVGVQQDLVLIRWIRGMAAPWLDRFMLFSFRLASWETLVLLGGLAVLFLILRRRYADAATLAILGAGAAGLALLLKSILVRPRPNLFPPLAAEQGPSFPSGEAMVAIVFYGFLLFLLLRSGQLLKKPLSLLAVLTLTAAGSFAGLSGIYMGVHWPTDILGGYIAGGAWLLFGILIREEWRLRAER